MSNKNFIVAIDGPVGSGKGTIGVILAKRINALYFYTGGMYRALALACIRKKIDLENEAEVLNILKSSKIDLHISRGETKVFLNGENINEEIFLPAVANTVPIVSQHPKVRKEMVKRQQEMIKNQKAVVEGRDVATDIAPDADVKIHLTADVGVRARRRYDQLKERNVNKSFKEVLKDTMERDRLDTERETSPLIIASDAYVLDTTRLTIDETINEVMNRIDEKFAL